MSGLTQEFGRKAFHMLSLVYLAAYLLIGYPRVLYPLAVWLAVVAAVETARLRSEAVNRSLTQLFRGLIRESEHHSFSGIFHTTAGALLTMLLAGDRPRVVAMGLLCLALGDAAAALAGKAYGRRRILGGAKSLEGSLACFSVCLAVGAALGLGPAAAAGGALAATLVELLPTSAWCNDNLWMPVASAAAVMALGRL